jgi:hypothetical protein
MNETTLSSPTIEKLTFKGRFKGRRCHFMPKVISRRIAITDAFNNRFKTTMTVFIPKITHKYPTLQVMLHIVNGAGSVLIRAKDHNELADKLEQIVNELRSDIWLDLEFRVDDIAKNIIDTGELPLAIDESIIDINEWKDSLINDYNVDSVVIKTNEGKDTKAMR